MDINRNADKLPGANKGATYDLVAGTLILLHILQKGTSSVHSYITAQSKKVCTTCARHARRRSAWSLLRQTETPQSSTQQSFTQCPTAVSQELG